MSATSGSFLSASKRAGAAREGMAGRPREWNAAVEVTELPKYDSSSFSVETASAALVGGDVVVRAERSGNGTSNGEAGWSTAAVERGAGFEAVPVLVSKIG